jgi:hypothetical protein
MPLTIINSCKRNDLESLKLSLSTQSVDSIDLWGRTHLYYSVKYLAYDLVRYLIHQGSDIFGLSKVDDTNEDLLLTSLKTGDNLMIKIISDYYTDHPQCYNHIKVHIVYYLPYLFKGQSQILSDFIDRFNISSLKGYENIFCRTAKKSHYDTLCESVICFDLQNALKFTIIYCRYQQFIHLLKKIKYPEQLDYIYRGPMGTQQTLISLCCTKAYYKGIQKLIDMGADYNQFSINEKGEPRNPIMVIADSCGYKKLNNKEEADVKKSLNYLTPIIDIDQQNSRGQTALMFAYRSNPELVPILESFGCNSDIIDMDNKKAINYSRLYTTQVWV